MFYYVNVSFTAVSFGRFLPCKQFIFFILAKSNRGIEDMGVLPSPLSVFLIFSLMSTTTRTKLSKRGKKATHVY
jgi:hypothetical protein